MSQRGPKSQRDPSPRQIKSMCLAIQNGRSQLRLSAWTDRDYHIRAGWSPVAADKKDHWIAPLVRLEDMGLTESDILYEEYK